MNDSRRVAEEDKQERVGEENISPNEKEKKEKHCLCKREKCKRIA